MTPDMALDVTAALWLIPAVASLIIAIPQALLLLRTTPPAKTDKLYWFRVKSVLLFGSLGLAMIRNVAVWWDLAYFDQRFLGPIATRWPLDMAIAFLISAACTIAAVLFVQTQWED